MAFTIDDIMQQLRSIAGGGNYQGNGVTTYAAPNPAMAQTGPNNNASFPVPGNVVGGGASTGLGFNAGTLGMGLQGLSALSGLLQGSKALNLAQDQFKLQKNMANANMNNSIKSYNTALEDRLNSRAVAENRSPESAAEQIERNRLTR